MNTFRKLASNLRLPVWRGPNKGVWWSVATSIRDFRGEFVCGKTAALEHVVLPGDIVWDIGSHQGWTVVLESRLVGPTGQTWAFEPSPRNRDLLEKHVRWNKRTNVTIRPYAMGNSNSEATFGWDEGQHDSRLTGHLGGEGTMVQVRTVDALIASGEAPVPTLLKIDTEGAEIDILEGARNLFRSAAVRCVVLATHTRKLHEQCCRFLESAGFDMIEARNVEIVREEGWESLGDADVLAVRRGAAVSPKAIELFRAIDRVG